jgi:hypothetical protein
VSQCFYPDSERLLGEAGKIMVACAAEGALPIFAEGLALCDSDSGAKMAARGFDCMQGKGLCGKEASCCLDFLVTFLSRKK